jgi:chromosome segregation ATPase
MSDWRDDFADQNRRMAQKMLEQQGQVNRLTAEVASLTAERDRLREERDAARLHYGEALTDRVTVEGRLRRALASLTAEREQTARMRAVVEAAKAYVRQAGGVGDNRALAVRLLTAVDALDAGAATGGEDDHG